MKMESENNNATNGALERHLDSSTILAVRLKSGRAELHTTSADEFFVVEGHASLLTGGAIVNPSGTAEVRGDSVRGGTRAELKAGDVVHIPANTPHQLLLDNTGPFVYVLVKIPAVLRNRSPAAHPGTTTRSAVPSQIAHYRLWQ
jgi:mannose-6-phosphate isomerase-like protein (cupin superfamily)